MDRHSAILSGVSTRVRPAARACALNGDPGVGAPGSIQHVSSSGRVRHRAIICMLAALLALMDWGWVQTLSLHGTPEPFFTGVNINGTRIDLACRGRGPATIVVVGKPLVDTVINKSVQAELARSVLLCTLTVREGQANSSPSSFADVLRGMLIGGNVAGPYVIVSHVSESTASDWMTGPLAPSTAGLVLIGPSSSIVVRESGDRWALPVGDRDATVLAILKLFWPPDEA